jgi:hypothetical protein
MRLRPALLLLSLGSCAPPPAASGPRVATELTGRIAGPPQHCVPIERDIGMRVADGDRGTLLYGTGRRIWANHLPAGCGFNQSDVLVVQPIGADYCRGDFVRSFDPVSRFPGPSCYLSDFVPYTLASPR